MSHFSHLPLTITLQGHSITPFYADACKNTFLIYDLIEQTDLLQSNWDNVQKQIFQALKTTHAIDDALLLRKIAAEKKHLDVKMHVLEPDGTEADFCGNGARAVGTYLLKTYGKSFDTQALISRLGKHAILNKDGTCFIKMGAPLVDKNQLLFTHKQKEYRFTFVDAVEPHLVTSDFFDKELLTEVGEAINASLKSRFTQGVNVNCVKKEDDHTLACMTYERGLYRITQACGTGSTACLASMMHHGLISDKYKTYKIKTLGGVLELLYDTEKNFWLGGPVQFTKIEK